MHVPHNLREFMPIIGTVHHDDATAFKDSYVYLTAKTLWVSGEYIGNRPGWHSDGFGTDDVNYIWADRVPTDFLHAPAGLELSQDCDTSLQQMASYARRPGMYGAEITQFPDKHLLRLDQSVIHRSPVGFEPGMRTFVKVSLSKNRYNLVGNSTNGKLTLTGRMFDRATERNHPARDCE